MKMIRTALALALLTGGATVAVAPALAAAQDKPAAERKYDISKGARPLIADLQTAVNAKDYANVPAKAAAAQAAAKTADDRYIIAKLQLKAAADQNDTNAIGSAIEAILASGVADKAEITPLYVNLGKVHYNAKAYDKAAAAFEKVLQADPANVEATVLLAESRNAQKRPAEAVDLIQKAIAAKTAKGEKVDEAWYKRAVALAFEAKMPAASTLSRDWVKAYPTAQSWRDALRIYQSTSGLADSDLIDVMRLGRATKSLAGESDYFRFANALMLKGYPGEAKALLDEGFAAGGIKKASPTFGQIYASATQKSQGDRASLAATAKAAMAAPAARQAMATADAYYGYGDYAQAAELYKAALGKSGVDKDLANLRLGMALAGMGDKAGATAALNAVTGAKAEIARYWLLYLATRA